MAEELKVEDVNVLKTIKELYPNIENNEKANLTELVNQIISNMKILNPNNLKITQSQVIACVKTTVNRALEILEK
jgi:hypothetical protein